MRRQSQSNHEHIHKMRKRGRKKGVRSGCNAVKRNETVQREIREAERRSGRERKRGGEGRRGGEEEREIPHVICIRVGLIKSAMNE